MMLLISMMLVAALTPTCDEALEQSVLARLATEADETWVVRCVDAQTVHLTRKPDFEGSRDRVVSLLGVSEPLRVDVVVMSAEALRRTALSAGPSRIEPPLLRPSFGFESEPAPTPESPMREPTAVRLDFAWRHQLERKPTPYAALTWYSTTTGRGFAGGEGGFEWRLVRIGAAVSGTALTFSQARVNVVGAQLFGSAALVCVADERFRGCLRFSSAVGAAWWSNDPVRTSSLLVASGVEVDFNLRVGPLWVGTGVRVGSLIGPMISFGRPTDSMSFAGGLSLHATWARD